MAGQKQIEISAVIFPDYVPISKYYPYLSNRGKDRLPLKEPCFVCRKTATYEGIATFVVNTEEEGYSLIRIFGKGLCFAPNNRVKQVMLLHTCAEHQANIRKFFQLTSQQLSPNNKRLVTRDIVKEAKISTGAWFLPQSTTLVVKKIKGLKYVERQEETAEEV